MKRISQPAVRDSGTKCAVCRTYSRPIYVPWEQHAVGCAVRTAALRSREPELRQALRAVSVIVA